MAGIDDHSKDDQTKDGHGIGNAGTTVRQATDPNGSQGADQKNAQAAALAILLETWSRREARALLLKADGPLDALSSLPAWQRLRAGSAARSLIRECAGRGVSMLANLQDGNLPAPLSTIPDPPLLLYAKGDVAATAAPALAIVGARRASRYGLQIATELAGALAGRGVTIVSGLALGVDGAAHRGALAAGGRTVAVLGSGLAKVQPVTHSGLAAQIAGSGGLLLSEYPLHRGAAAWHFPERNRIISGLCVGVLVIEASAHSGSLITARLALEQGREVMAVPGAPGLPASAGVNRLLKQGAALIETAEDVVDALGLHLDRLPDDLGAAGLEAPDAVSAQAASLLALLGAEPIGMDALCAARSLSAQDAAVRLTELEIAGFVERVADGYIRRPRF